MRVVKWHKAVTKTCDDINDAWLSLLKGYAELDDKGNFAPRDGQPGTWKFPENFAGDPANMQKHWDDVQEFNKLEVETDITPLPFEELHKIELSPAEVDALGELLATGPTES